VWIYTGNKAAKFHENTLSLSANVAKSFRGLRFYYQNRSNKQNTQKTNLNIPTDLYSEKAFRPCSSIGVHFVVSSCKTTYEVTSLPKLIQREKNF